MQTRSVRCVETGENGSRKIVSDGQCLNSMRQQGKPIERQECNRHDCPGKWRYGKWTECSKTCGSGIRRRQIQCTGGVLKK